MSNIFDWKKFSQISAANGQFDNVHATGIDVNNNINTKNGVFTNLSAASRLSALNLTSKYITRPNLTAMNANITNLTVGGQPYQHLSVMTQTAYNAATKKANYFYFTYPG